MLFKPFRFVIGLSVLVTLAISLYLLYSNQIRPQQIREGCVMEANKPFWRYDGVRNLCGTISNESDVGEIISAEKMAILYVLAMILINQDG